MTTITLLSNANTGKWEENSLVEFGNTLPSELTCSSDNEIFAIAIKTLILDTKFDTSDDIFFLYQQGGESSGHHTFVKIHKIHFSMHPEEVIAKINENKFPSNMSFSCHPTTKQCIITLQDIKTKFSICLLELLGFIPQDLYEYNHAYNNNNNQTSNNDNLVWHASYFNNSLTKKRIRLINSFGDTPKSITSSNQINAMRLLPKFIEVHLSNVMPTASDVSDMCTFRHSLNVSRNDLSIKIAPIQLQYAASSQTNIAEFKITIFDDKKQKLKFKKGQCTIVQLYIKKMPLNQYKETFFIQINSTKSSHVFPGNTISNFTANLINPISLSVAEDWSVACRSLTIPMNFCHYPLSSAEGSIGLQTYASIHYAQFGKRHFPSNQSLLKELNLAIFALTQTQTIKCTLNSSNHLQLSIIDEAEKLPEETRLIIHSDLFTLLGGGEVKLDHPFLSEEGSYILMTLPQTGTITMDYPVDRFALLPRAVFVYSSLVSNTMLGSNETNLLKIYHLEQKQDPEFQDQYTTLETTHLEYVPLAVSELRNISFQLKDVTGRLLTFAKMENPALISLVFRLN